MAGALIDCAGRVLDLSTPRVMGVLNITPDSFSDGGRWLRDGHPNLDALRREAEAMVVAGAVVLDVGGESTRPGAQPVSLQEELDRVIPVIEAIAVSTDVVVSVDTSTAEVMREAAAVGAGMINDVRALRRGKALQVACATGLPVCLMHMQGEPDIMQDSPHYEDIVTDVGDFLLARARACEHAGLDAAHILIDPGFGFGKTVKHNLALLAGLPKLQALGYPVLAGLSRKSLIAALTGRDVADRLAGSITLALLAAQRGAALLRVHDVAQTVDALRVLRAVEQEEVEITGVSAAH